MAMDFGTIHLDKFSFSNFLKYVQSDQFDRILDMRIKLEYLTFLQLTKF